ncbi:unnamed protein product [Lathyrus sativus]|nr:unnamed protein product [Lathyrus sativus]
MALFSTNLKVLVIHHDVILLEQIQEMCDRFHYLVTKCTSASYALNLLAESKGYFDILLSDVCMSNMDSYNFVQNVTLHHKIPVIVISSDATKSSVIESIINGACDYWLQPLHEKQFKTMWQHVARKTLMENKEHQDLGFLNVGTDKEPEVLGILETQSHQEDENLEILKAQSHKEPEVLEMLEAPRHSKKSKKSRLSWTRQLHQKFVNAVNQLGLDEAKPRNILKIMDISDLTTAHVASHLQKYRNYLKRPSCGKKSKKSPRIETPAECINKTSLESEDAHSMLQEDQSSQLNSTLHSDNIFETQQQSNDVTNYQVPDSGYNYETQQQSNGVTNYQVPDSGYNYETQQQSNDVTNYQVPDSGYNYETQQQSNGVTNYQVPDSGYNYETQQQSNDVTNYQVSDSGYNYETQQHSTDVGDYRVSNIMSNDFPDPSDVFFDLEELMSLLI